MAAKIINYSTGRMALHLAAALRDRKWRWHLAGIGREVRLQFNPSKRLGQIVADRNTLRAIIVAAIVLSQLL